jgi:hypothetical protein
MSGATNRPLDGAGTPSPGAQPGQQTRTSARTTKKPEIFVAESATADSKHAAHTYASKIGEQKIEPAEGPASRAPAGAYVKSAHMIELDKIAMEERVIGMVHDRPAHRHVQTLQSQTNSNAREMEIPGIDNPPDMNSLKLNGGTLLERLDRFEEVRNGGGGNHSWHWPAKGPDQPDVRPTTATAGTRWSRCARAWHILQGDAQEMSERLQGLLWDLETNSVLRHEFLEQRKVRAEHEFSEQRKIRAKLAVPDPERQATLAEYASYVRTPMGKGFSGGFLELAALGEISEQNVYLWTRQTAGAAIVYWRRGHAPSAASRRPRTSTWPSEAITARRAA